MHRTALGALVLFMGIIIYSVGYCKLTGAVGYKNKTVRKIGLLTRNVAICLTFSVLSSLACEFVAAGKQPQSTAAAVAVCLFFVTSYLFVAVGQSGATLV
jgi:hypothetical protein